MLPQFKNSNHLELTFLIKTNLDIEEAWYMVLKELVPWLLEEGEELSSFFHEKLIKLCCLETDLSRSVKRPFLCQVQYLRNLRQVDIA